MNTKGLVWAISTACILFTITYAAHSMFLGCPLLQLDCPIAAHYIFHYLFALIVVLVFTIMAKNPKLLQQLGFIYLGVLAFKLLLHAAIFSHLLLATTETSPVSEGHYLIPVFAGLLVEILVLRKLLNNTPTKS